MEIVSVRCHAAVSKDTVLPNVIIKFAGSSWPEDGVGLTVESSDISVGKFNAEIHSTVSYNGIAVLGLTEINSISLREGDLALKLLEIRQSFQPSTTQIKFIPFMN